MPRFMALGRLYASKEAIPMRSAKLDEFQLNLNVCVMVMLMPSNSFLAESQAQILLFGDAKGHRPIT
jgi:hypothetical protein